MCKAMLMIDLPEHCEDCPCSTYILDNDEVVCKLTDNPVYQGQRRPRNCPLIPVDMCTMDSILKAVKTSELTHMNPITYLLGK